VGTEKNGALCAVFFWVKNTRCGVGGRSLLFRPVFKLHAEKSTAEVLATHGLLGRASTKPPTLLRNEGWGTLRGDLWAWQEVEIGEGSFFAVVRMSGYPSQRFMSVARSWYPSRRFVGLARSGNRREVLRRGAPLDDGQRQVLRSARSRQSRIDGRRFARGEHRSARSNV
jgi:hypothetical protein